MKVKNWYTSTLWCSGRKSTLVKACAALIVLLLFACGSYKHPDGSKERFLKPVKDYYKEVDEQQTALLADFDPKNIGRPYSEDKAEKWAFEEVDMNDLQAILDRSQRSMLVFWYPNCGSILPLLMQEVRKAKQLEDDDFQIVMLNSSYLLDQARHNLENYFDYRRQAYVLDHSYGKYLINKQYEFVNSYCPDCFDRYGRRINDIYLFVHDRDEGIVYDGLFVWNEEEKKNELYDSGKLNELLYEGK